jgi:hypothetical protein
MDSVRNPPRPVKQPRLGSFTSDSLFDKVSYLKVWNIQTDPISLDSVISDDPNWYKAEPSPPLPDPANA